MDNKVSVLITTYNQEKYVAQAVESALRQEVDFPFEIVIGDDCSTDHTRVILEKLSKSHPERIRLSLRNKKGEGLPGKINFVETLKACQGQFIALLDGDDYWTDVQKLQKQVNFLEGHTEYAFCFHNASIVRKDETPDPAKRFCPPDQEKTCTLEDLTRGNFIFAGSTMFRRGLFGQFPAWFYTAQTGDWLLHVFNAQYGKIGYLDEVMAVYRVHAGSSWASSPPRHRLIDQIDLLDKINAHLEFKYDKTIKATQYQSLADLAEIAYSQGDPGGARTFLVKRVRLGLSIYRLPTKRELGRLVKLYNPALVNLIRSLRDSLNSPRS
jgi:glycosyltransferase involved in cell wall biosynthesis